MKPRRRLKKIWVDFISLVEEGANRKTIIWKSVLNLPGKTPLDHTFPILKVDTDQRMVYGIVYAPNEVDTDGDIAAAEVIKEAAYRFMREKQEDRTGEPGEDTRSIDKRHNENPDQGYVAESWIVRKDDAFFPDDIGAWAVGIKIEDDDTWEEIKKGRIKGLSMGGESLVEDLNKEDESMPSKKTLNAITEAVEKAFVSFNWSGEVGAAEAGPISIKDDLSALLKDIETPEQAAAVIEGIGKFNEQLTTDVKDLLKGITTASPASPALTPVPPVKESVEGELDATALVKSVVDTVSAGLEPVTKAITGVTERLDALEKSGVGRQSGLPIKEAAENGSAVPNLTGVLVED